MNRTFQEVTAAYRNVVELSHKQRVTRMCVPTGPKRAHHGFCCVQLAPTGGATTAQSAALSSVNADPLATGATSRRRPWAPTPRRHPRVATAAAHDLRAAVLLPPTRTPAAGTASRCARWRAGRSTARFSTGSPPRSARRLTPTGRWTPRRGACAQRRRRQWRETAALSWRAVPLVTRSATLCRFSLTSLTRSLALHLHTVVTPGARSLTARLVREAEERLASWTHPDPWVNPYMAGGSRFMRNPAMPLKVRAGAAGEQGQQESRGS
jgi:hypothetical protein